MGGWNPGSAFSSMEHQVCGFLGCFVITDSVYGFSFSGVRT